MGGLLSKKKISMTLHNAAMLDQVESIKTILETRSVDINALDEAGATALHYAAIFGHLGALNILLNKGADIDAFDSDGSNILHYTVMYKRSEALNYLLDRGADIDACNTPFKNNAFIIALSCGNDEAPGILLDRGININSCNNMGISSLLFAIRLNNVEGIKMICGSKRLLLKSFTTPSTDVSFEEELDRKIDCAETKRLVLETKEKAERWNRRSGGRGTNLMLCLAAAGTRYKTKHKIIEDYVQETLEDLDRLSRLDGAERNPLVQKINKAFENLESYFYDTIQQGGRSFVDEQLLRLENTGGCGFLLDEKTNKVEIVKLAKSEATNLKTPGIWSKRSNAIRPSESAPRR